MIVVVDTNIIFSALLNTKSNIGDLLLNSDDNFVFTVVLTCELK